MDRYRASASSMSSVFSSSSVSNTPARQQESITNNQSMFTSGASELPQSAEPLEAALGLRATTLGTVVVRCGSIQLVIALLQSPDKIFIKVLELEPKITALGANLEESLQMKQEHDQVMRNVEDLPGPMEEFQQKANKLLASKRINIDVVNAMSDTLNIIWRDTIYLLHDRQQLLKKSCAFHEKMVHCQKYMDQLEAACIDAMLPIEVHTVQEVLNKFKQLRIDMLTAVMAALKEGNEMLALLQELAQPESPGTRPEHIKRDAARAEHQVQCWLEALHDRRNGLEIAWQTRKTQLEQCLSLALLTREQQEVETALQKQRKEVMSAFTLGDCEQTANNGLHNYREFKHQAQQLRDRALKITRGKEKLQASGTFSGDEACAKTYEVLNNCTEHLELVDQREHWLQQARDFFAKGTHTLEVLKKLEKELSRTEHNNNASESFTIFSKMSLDVNRFTEEPLRLGKYLLEEVGQGATETAGVKRLFDELLNIKDYIESICSVRNESQERLQRAMDEFEAKHKDLLDWLTLSGQMYLQQYTQMGRNLDESKHFLLQHHELMQDLEIKGELINLLLESIKTHLEALNPQQRYEVDCKAETLHKHWIELKDLVLKRVDYVSILIDFYESANKFSSQLNNFNAQLEQIPEEQKLQSVQESWADISKEYANVKKTGKWFINMKILDPYIDVQPSVAAVQEIIDGFSKRQIHFTNILKVWTTQLSEKREIEIILEKIMCENEEASNKTKKVDTQLYPVFTTSSVAANDLLQASNEKLKLVLSDIEKAQQEIQERLATTTSIRTNDRESQRKIEEVISNLETLTSKLDGIKYDYKSLLDAIINYLKNIESLQQEIHTYFSQRHVQEDSLVTPGKQENIERTISEHEHFREGCMVKFRALITQSELLIDRVRMQEPPGAKEIDADRILVLLENLRTYFESNCSDRMCSLKRLEKLEQFRCDLNDIHSSLDSVCKQLNEINGQNMESLASAKTTSLAFEYFERTIELLEKRIDQLSETSKEQAKNLSPQSKEYVLQELNKLNDKWANFKTQVKQKRNALNKTVQFYEETEKIDAEYRELSYFYDSLSNKIPYIRDAVEAANLVNDIEKHVISREAALLDKLNQLNQDSPNVNRVSMLYSEIRSLFQSFTKLKFDINIVEERIKKEERNKEAQAQAERERVLQEEQARLEQIKQQEQQASSVKPTELLPAHAERLQTLQDEIDQHRIVSQNIRKEIEVNQIFTEMKYVAPYFTRPLQDACTREGDKFVFECEVRGYPEPQIEWYKDGLSIQTNLDYKTTYDSGVCRLLIEETLTADTGSFRCRASNILGAVDTTAVLSVRENAVEEQMIPPSIERVLESGHAKEGSSFEFYCKVSGHPLPTVQWFKNDKCIDDMPDYVISYNNGEASLRLEEVFLEDDAVYTCRVSNPLGVEHCSARLLVEPLEPTVAPHFITPLSNVMGRVGQKMKLEAIVNGIPKPDIYWMHNNKPYYPRELKYENESVTLIISQAYPSDAGIYVLTAKNLAGETSCACNVIVKGRLPNETSDSELASDMEPIKPTVQLPLKDISVFEGKPVRLDCVIVGQPEPEVIWYHNERPVKESSDVQLLFQGDRCSLIMPEAYQDDAGAYKVVAINSAGEAVSKCEVKVMPVNNVPLPVNELKTSEPLVKEMQPIFEKFLSDILADEGQTVEMEVLVKGDAPLSAKWFLTNNELAASERIIMEQLPMQGVFKLIIKNVTAEDRGVYTVKVQNLAGEAKCFSNLIVKSINASDSQRQQQQQQQVSIVEHNQRPEFKELFYDKGVCVDDMAKFECIVKGKPTPKVRWYFNDQPVQGHNFLVSTSGERQLLTIQKVSTETVGKISCVAENEVGKAVCEAFLSLHGSGLQFPPATSSVQRSTEEYNSGSSVVTIKKQSYQTSSSSQVQTFEGNLPHKEVYHTYAYIDNQPAEVQSHHYEEIHKVRDVSGPTEGESGSSASTPTRVRKQIAPRFTTPLQGKIVDQGADVTLEAIYDGFPGPIIKVEKNGEKLNETERVKIENKCNRVTINLKNVGVPDAGRYAVTATNIVGESTSTADVVVKKTIFPPVFGHRLQAQVLKKGEQLVMEVEVTGLPEPNVTWMKDNKPLQEAGLSTHRLVSLGNSHKLIIEKAQLSDSGKYMVVATNAGGEAKSIADCAVLEPSPERLQEVVKTLVYQQPTDVETKEIGKESITTQTDLQELTNKGDFHGISESKIITEHRCTMEATMRLEHKTSHLDLPKLTKRPQTPNGQDTTDATNQSYIEHAQFPQTYPKVTPTPTQVLPTAGEVTNTSNEISSEQSIKSSLYDLLHRSENSRVENAAKKVQIKIPIKLEEQKSTDFNLQPGTPPEICFAPKIQTGSSVQATIERIEQSAPTKQEPQLVAHTTIVSKDVKLEFPKPVEPLLRATSPKCSAEGAAMTRLWGKPMSNKSENVSDLNAPFLVQKANYALLEPGSPPEICFAPKPAERRQSLVETMERTLEKNLIQGPSKVLPHSVPTLTPPSASPATTQKPTVARPPPPTLPTHLSATRYDIYESDYESDRYKYSGSESDDTSLHPKPCTAEFQQAPLPAKTSGYAADTEDPHTNQYFTSSFEKQAPAPIYYTTSNGNEQLLENEYKNDKQDSYTSSQTCNILYKSNATSTTPSKFAGTTVLNIPSSNTARQTPAEFSDYSSEVEDRFRSVSRNYESETDIKGYRVVFPPTPTPTKSAMGNGHKSPIVVVTPSPMEFEPTPPAVTTYARPKFEPIQKEKPKEYETNVTTNQFKKQTQQTQYQKQNQQQQHVFKPKPVAAKFLAATQQQQSKFSEPREQGSTLYYNAYAGTPLHTAKMATETTNLTEMESSNTCQRVVNMQRTKQVYHFESQQEKTSSSAQYESYSSPSGTSTPAHQVRLPKPPTPTKFTPCEFRESNYKSEFENAKIRPLWSPYGDKHNTRYRHVNAPQGTGRSASLPRSYERVQSPMEFDRGPEMPTNIFDKLRQEKSYNQPNTQTLQRHSSLRSTSSTQKNTQQSSSKKTTVEVTRYPAAGSPPKYGYVASKAQDHGQHMQSTFMQKSSKFMQDISADMNSNSYTKSQLDGGSAPGYQCDLKTMVKQEGGAPQAYRDETRVSQYAKEQTTEAVYDDQPKCPPFITTPLKEIAVIAGQQARFECMVNCHPVTRVTWTHNNQVLQDSMKHVLEYRNGICRLTLPCAFPDDAGTYACTITNHLGTATTIGQLVVQAKNRAFKY